MNYPRHSWLMLMSITPKCSPSPGPGPDCLLAINPRINTAIQRVIIHCNVYSKEMPDLGREGPVWLEWGSSGQVMTWREDGRSLVGFGRQKVSSRLRLNPTFECFCSLTSLSIVFFHVNFFFFPSPWSGLPILSYETYCLAIPIYSWWEMLPPLNFQRPPT